MLHKIFYHALVICSTLTLRTVLLFSKNRYTKMLLVFYIMLVLNIGDVLSTRRIQWNYFDKIMSPYFCKGNSDWIEEVSDLGLRLLMRVGKLMYCKEEEVDASRPYKDFLRLIRSIKHGSARYYCYKNATSDSLRIIYCDDIEYTGLLMDDVMLIISRIMVQSCSPEDCTAPWCRYCYLKGHYGLRPDIRYLEHFLIRSVAQSIGFCRPTLRRERRKRFYDEPSLIYMISVGLHHTKPTKDGQEEQSKLFRQSAHAFQGIIKCILLTQ